MVVEGRLEQLVRVDLVERLEHQLGRVGDHRDDVVGVVGRNQHVGRTAPVVEQLVLDGVGEVGEEGLRLANRERLAVPPIQQATIGGNEGGGRSLAGTAPELHRGLLAYKVA